MDKETSNSIILEYQKELISLINRLTYSDGVHSTAIPCLSLIRASNGSKPVHSIYEPSLCVVAQGSKIVMLANERYQYDLNSYLVASVRLPVSAQIVEATPEKPYLCAQLHFTSDEIFNVLKETDKTWSDKIEAKKGLFLNKTSSSLLDAMLRLIRILDTPKDIPFLYPMITREILYRILNDEHGNLIRQFVMTGSHANKISKIIQLINQNFSKPLRIAELAKDVNMSSSALHNQFKKVTGMSPLQYQKLIRLQEARRLLLSETAEAATVGFQVGYESPSQFSREYARLFGLPPISDIKRIQSTILT